MIRGSSRRSSVCSEVVRVAKYTTELRHIVEQAEMDAHGKYVPFEYTSAAFEAVALDKYPIFDESYRTALNSKIIDHFYMREIGAETAGLFRLYVRRTMQEVMPRYNALYVAQRQMTDPMTDRENVRTEAWETDTTRDWGNQSSTETEAIDENQNVYSDTPMSMLSNAGSPDVKNLDYATNVTYDDGSSLSKGLTSATGNDTGSEAGNRSTTETGRGQTQAELYEKLRRAYDNLDQQVINELEICFMQMY